MFSRYCRELAIFVDVDCRIFMLLFLLFASPHSKQLQYLAALPEAVSDFFQLKVFSLFLRVSLYNTVTSLSYDVKRTATAVI